MKVDERIMLLEQRIQENVQKKKADKLKRLENDMEKLVLLIDLRPYERLKKQYGLAFLVFSLASLVLFGHLCWSKWWLEALIAAVVYILILSEFSMPDKVLLENIQVKKHLIEVARKELEEEAEK